MADLERVTQMSFRKEPVVKFNRLDSRIPISGVVGTLCTAKKSAVVRLIDGSRNGAGLKCPIAIGAGRQVLLRIADEPSSILLEGEVRYCSLVATEKQEFRIGIRLYPADSESSERWEQMLSGRLSVAQAT